jgi:hypothetical protein
MMMPKPETKLQKDPEKQARQQRKAAIAKHVLHALGEPQDLHRVQVRYVWEEHYRVNVLIGVDAACVKVGHSFFLVADRDGNILASTPEIAKHY